VSGRVGFQEPLDTGSDFSAQSFLVDQIIGKLATTALVKVAKVYSVGEVQPVGKLDVIPMVHQIDGDGSPTEHQTIYGLPYFRLQGGTDAVILDPKVGDIGIAVFCSRDISIVARSKKPSAPASRRRFDWADGLYIGGVLNGVPQQYVRFAADGVHVVSPTKIQLISPIVNILANTIGMYNQAGTGIANATMNVNITNTGTITNTGNVATAGTLTNNAHDVGSTHRHVNSGGTGIGGIPQ
jgi:hypothetical protein